MDEAIRKPSLGDSPNVVRHDRSLLPLIADRLCFCAGSKVIIDNVSFRLDGGSRTVILGPNGAGKSVLLRLCHGLLEPTSGSLSWGGRSAARAARRQGMVFQRPVLLRRTVADNVAHALAAKSVPRRERAARVATALERAGLSSLASMPARRLSGGEQQRLSIARACVTDPQVLLLDEPSSSLDPAATRAVESLIAEVDAEGTRVIMTTHDIAQARRLAEDVLFIHKGKLLEHARADLFFEGPNDPSAARFIEGELID